MPVVHIGTRRLYDALGVGAPTSGEILQKVNFASGKNVSLYIGPHPPFGITALEGSQYGIPGRDCLILKTNNEYTAPCFLEVTISEPREVTSHQLELIREKNQGVQEGLLQEARKDSEQSAHLLDAISGVLGLRVHRQFVLKPLIENAFLSGDIEPVSSFTGPFMEILEGIELNSNTGPHIQQLLEGMTKVPEDLLLDGGATLHWLLRAWRENDAISKFMYLFIPLEAVLQSSSELVADSKGDLESLESIVKSSDAPNKESLLQFLDRAKTKFGPTLNARFEEFARSAAIPGWELDVKAFKKYNRMRNLLLHAGNKHVRSHIDFDENTRTLEDLVERYVSIALLGNAEVYKSRWRPSR